MRTSYHQVILSRGDESVIDARRSITSPSHDHEAGIASAAGKEQSGGGTRSALTR
jgi:hypothetical protein